MRDPLRDAVSAGTHGDTSRLRRSPRGRSGLPGGFWRALPRSAFGPGAALSLVTVGSFVVRGGDILNVWCDDVGVRRRTLLERVDFYLSYRANPDRADTEAL